MRSRFCPKSDGISFLLFGPRDFCLSCGSLEEKKPKGPNGKKRPANVIRMGDIVKLIEQFEGERISYLDCRCAPRQDCCSMLLVRVGEHQAARSGRDLCLELH